MKLRPRPFMMIVAAVLVMWGVVLPGSASVAAPAPMCGKAGTVQQIKHVVVIFMENTDYGSVVGNSAAPFQNQVAAACGTPTNMHGLIHPSLQNYLAFAGGTIPPGTGGDCSPSASCSSSGPSLFSQVDQAGLSWRAYEEDMPKNCYKSSSGKYAPRHNPALYYTALKTCAANDVPMGTLTGGALYDAAKKGTLPSLSFITPNNVHNTHDSNTATGDKFLSQLIPLLTGGANYQAGDTAIFITNDEGKAGNLIPSFVIAPYVKAGLKVNQYYDHYSLAKTVEELLGLPTNLAHTADAKVVSLTKAFGLVAGKPAAAADKAPVDTNPTQSASPSATPSASADGTKAEDPKQDADAPDPSASRAPSTDTGKQPGQPPLAITPVTPLIICVPKDGKPIHLSFAPDVGGDALWIRLENC